MTKILTIDIETSPALAYVWRTFKETISNEQIVEPTRIITFACKWFGEKKIDVFTEWDEGGHEGMVDKLFEFMDEADVIVSYNGKSFDVPHINREFIEHGLYPPSPFKHIDLYMTVRSKFNFMSGKLGYVTKDLDLGGKMAHEGFALWSSVLAGDKDAQKRMAKYNAQDVKITEDLYVELLPWLTDGVNMALFEGTVHACPKCASANLEKRGFAYTGTSKYQRYHCNNCGGYSRSGQSLATTGLRQIL